MATKFTLEGIARDRAENSPKAACFVREPMHVFEDGAVEFACPVCDLTLIRGATGGWLQRTTIRCQCGQWCDLSHVKGYRVHDVFSGNLSPLFRGFKERQHLEAFLEGNVRISSLYSWKNTEDAVRLDVGEGESSHTIDALAARRLDREQSRLLRRVGIDISGSVEDVEFRNVVGVQKTPNSPGLSMSLHASTPLREKLGRHWVRLDKPAQFLERASEALARFYPLRFGIVMPIIYKSRATKNGESNSVPPFLIKPIEYSGEAEVRFIWFVAEPNLVTTYTDINLGTLGDICVDVSL